MARKRTTPQPASEALVSWIWQEGRLAPDLRAVDGRAVAAVFRGLAGDGSGPDFRDALIAVEGRLVRGDVEIHVRTSHWQAHGHSGDSRYRDVILHVVLEHDLAATTTEGAPILELAAQLDAPLPILAELAKLEPGAPGLCGSLVNWEDVAAGELLDALGDDRFAEKVARADTALDAFGPDEALQRALLDALGITRNRGPMLQLAERLPYRVIEGLLAGKPAERRRSIAAALLLGAGGFLGSHGDDEQRRLWREYGDGAPPSGGWDLFRVRPANHPARRLLTYAALVSAAGEAGLFAYLVAGWPASGVAGLRRRLATPTVESLGADRAGLIVLDVLLPLIAARESGVVRRDGHAWKAYRLAPRLAENAITRLMTWQLFASPAKTVVDSARRQQGLLQLYHTWCRPQRGAECPVCSCAPAAVLPTRAAGRPIP